MAPDHPWTEPPRPGAAIDVLPGIKWLRMPLPFRLDHINLWLLDDGPGWTVVDTGIGLEETRALWERVFAETLDGRPLTRVVVTHFHPDHMGNAGWLTERDRKSTRLNSSHLGITYTVFFLNAAATPESYTLSLHDALPISLDGRPLTRVVVTHFLPGHMGNAGWLTE